MTRKTQKDGRPPIWADGHQNPPLEPRAFALASVRYARQSVSGVLSRCARSASDGADRLAARTVPPAAPSDYRARLLHLTGRALRGAAALLSGAAQATLPEADRVPPRPPSIFDAPGPEGARPVDPVTDPEVTAIRRMMRTDATGPVPEMRAATGSPRLRAAMVTGLGTALGYGLLVVSVPVGAVLALMAHLNGEDLRRLVDDGI